MNYRHFDFPNTQGSRVVRPAESSGSAGSYMVVMVLVSLLAMLFGVAAVAALSKARPSEATTARAPVVVESRSVPAIHPEEGADDTGEAPSAPEEETAGDVTREPSSRWQMLAEQVATRLHEYEAHHGELAGFELGEEYRLSSQIDTPAGTVPLRALLGLEPTWIHVDDYMAPNKLVIVVLPESEWKIEVTICDAAHVGTYRLYRNGMEEFLPPEVER